MKIVLQQSLEYNGISYEPGEEVDVPENIYDWLVDEYTKERIPDVVDAFFFPELNVINSQ
jgi:hypothetical protein